MNQPNTVPPTRKLHGKTWRNTAPSTATPERIDPEHQQPDTRLIRFATPADLTYLVHLQRRHKNAVGFAPRGALLDRIETQRILVIEENAEPSGYLSYTHRKDGLTHVSQVAIDDGVWRTRAGTVIMKTLIDAATHAGSKAVTLKSALDLQANFFWPTVGFLPNGILDGHKRPLAAWIKPLTVTPLLMPQAPTTPRCRYLDPSEQRPR